MNCRFPAGLLAAAAFALMRGVAEGDAPPADSSPPPPSLLARMLDGPMKGVEEIVFAVRVGGRDHWYVNFGNYSDHSDTVKNGAFKFEDGVYWGYGEGGRLCALNLRTGKVRVLLDDPKGGVRDPQVHYSGRKILFSYRKGGTHTYHLCEIDSDGGNLRQLTDGPDDDIEPIYLPDGGIMFGSSRCRRFVNCWYSRVATLYRCEGDGSGVRMISSNGEHDNTPWVLNDGRVVYMRWEYVDRSQVDYHHLWTANPDGSNQSVFYGNLHPGIAMLDAKSIPGSEKVVASFSPGHGQREHEGFVTVLDPRRGPDDLSAARRISKQAHFRDPYAFSENCFLVANAEGLFVMDGEGGTEPIYRLPPEENKDRPHKLECHEPRPLVPRPREPAEESRVRLQEATGTMFLADVHIGRNMAGVKPGEIRKLLVLEQLPKPVNFSGGMEPLTLHGSFTLARILGTVPVEPDGSAYMEVPALRSVFFVALDENDLSVKRMQSWCSVQPGEQLGCIGCHEQRTQTAMPRPSLMALQRPPSRIQPFEGIPDVIDYPRDVQPILDRHCIKCHSTDRYDGKLDLAGGHAGMYTVSYWNMFRHRLVADGRNRAKSNYPPRSLGTSASRLMKFIDPSHYDVRLSDIERTTIRLWIESSATYPGTYSALGCGWAHAPIDYGRLRERCGECHGKEVKGGDGKPEYEWSFGPFIESLYSHGTGPEALCNLDSPEKSILLRAPLSKSAGGLDLCGREVFKNADDPDYKIFLEAIAKGGDALRTTKRFDMAGFRPNEHYLREMQRFGILPKELAPDAPVDPYATDQAYWRSFWYEPRVSGR
jgi:hypothetical protein